MAKHTIFTNSILTENYKNEILNKEIIEELKLQKNLGGRTKSNIGGFQSNSITNQNITKPILEKSAKMLFANYKIKAKKIGMLSLWINENKKGTYNAPHVHPRCHFSGVYYINVNKKNGELIFTRDIATMLTDQFEFINDDTDFKQNFVVSPENNLLVLFPSQLVHSVLPHDEDCTRISVSFNLLIDHG